MDFSKAFWIVGLALILVVIFNLAIYFGYARKGKKNEFDYLRISMTRARNPWEEEDANLKELSRRVADLERPNSIDTQENSDGKT